MDACNSVYALILEVTRSFYFCSRKKEISNLFSSSHFFSPFPSSLRFLIQQHLELLHTLQERVLKCQWQGIMGDVFMRLTSKEVNKKKKKKCKIWVEGIIFIRCCLVDVKDHLWESQVVVVAHGDVCADLRCRTSVHTDDVKISSESYFTCLLHVGFIQQHSAFF